MKQVFLISVGEVETSVWFQGRETSRQGATPGEATLANERSLQESTRTSPGIMSPATAYDIPLAPGHERHLLRAAIPNDGSCHMDHGLSFAAAESARASWMKRSATLSTTMPAITGPARASPVENETADKVAADHQRVRMIFIRRRNQPCWRSCATSFGPVCVRALRPRFVSGPPQSSAETGAALRRPSRRHRGRRVKRGWPGASPWWQSPAHPGAPVAPHGWGPQPGSID